MTVVVRVWPYPHVLGDRVDARRLDFHELQGAPDPLGRPQGILAVELTYQGPHVLLERLAMRT